MNLQQIKQESAALSGDDRLALQAFLIHLNRVDDPVNRQGLSECMARLEMGSKVSLAEFIEHNDPDTSSEL